MNTTIQHVKGAREFLRWEHTRDASADLTMQTAQDMEKQATSKKRYDGNEYFSSSGITPTTVMHPIQLELDGKHFNAPKDLDGFALLAGFVYMLRKNRQGFVLYLQPKLSMDQPLLRQRLRS